MIDLKSSSIENFRQKNELRQNFAPIDSNLDRLIRRISLTILSANISPGSSKKKFNIKKL